ncbi:ribosome maturation factor RimM [Chloroflexota bacterium]
MVKSPEQAPSTDYIYIRQHNKPSGKSEMNPPQIEFLTIGRILTTWGVEGKLKVKPETDFPQRFACGARVYIDRQPMIISASEWHGDRLAVKLETINSFEDARKLRGKIVEIHQNQAHSLPEGQYYHFQLIGLEVRTTRGELLGNITDIISAVSNDTYVVNGEKGEILIPAIEDVVKSVDLDKGHLIIEPIEGLLELNRKSN